MKALDHLFADTVALTALIGLLTPLVTAVFEQSFLTQRGRQVVALAVATVVGLLTAIANGALHGMSWIAVTVMVVGFAQGAYHEVYKRTPLRRATRAIENATSVQPPRRPGRPRRHRATGPRP